MSDPTDVCSHKAPTIPWALVGLALSMVMPSLDTSIANAGLPSVAAAFAARFQDAQWVVLAYLLTITTLIVSAGRLGDLIGRRRLLLIGIALFTVASLACGLAPTLGLLIAARGVQGVGGAIMMALTLAMVGDTVPKERTGQAMGLLGTMSALGTSLGPPLGGLLIEISAWPLIFLINIPLGLVNFILVAATLPPDRPRVGARPTGFDLAGTVLLATGLAAYALAMTMGGGLFDRGTLALLAGAVLAGCLFVTVERRVASPLVQLSLLQNRAMGAGLLVTVAIMAVMMTTLVVGPFYLSLGLTLSPVTVGLTLAGGPLVAVLSGIPAGRLVDRFGAAPMVRLGLVAMSLGLVTLAGLPRLLGVPGYLVAIALVTAPYALIQAANNTLILGTVSPDQRGVTAGLMSLARNLGLITGAAVMGALFRAATGGSPLAETAPSAIAAAMTITMASAALLPLAALVLSRWRGR